MSAVEPKCGMVGCNNKAEDDSQYCCLHDMSYKAYGNLDYNAVYENSQKNKDSYSGEYTSGSSSSGTSSSTKKYNNYSSYDEGYEDMYFDDDYDWDRYWSDSDYAAGVDDAMEDEEW